MKGIPPVEQLLPVDAEDKERLLPYLAMIALAKRNEWENFSCIERDIEEGKLTSLDHIVLLDFAESLTEKKNGKEIGDDVAYKIIREIAELLNLRDSFQLADEMSFSRPETPIRKIYFRRKEEGSLVDKIADAFPAIPLDRLGIKIIVESENARKYMQKIELKALDTETIKKIREEAIGYFKERLVSGDLKKKAKEEIKGIISGLEKAKKKSEILEMLQKGWKHDKEDALRLQLSRHKSYDNLVEAEKKRYNEKFRKDNENEVRKAAKNILDKIMNGRKHAILPYKYIPFRLDDSFVLTEKQSIIRQQLKGSRLESEVVGTISYFAFENNHSVAKFIRENYEHISEEIRLEGSLITAKDREKGKEKILYICNGIVIEINGKSQEQRNELAEAIKRLRAEYERKPEEKKRDIGKKASKEERLNILKEKLEEKIKGLEDILLGLKEGCCIGNDKIYIPVTTSSLGLEREGLELEDGLAKKSATRDFLENPKDTGYRALQLRLNISGTVSYCMDIIIQSPDMNEIDRKTHAEHKKKREKRLKSKGLEWIAGLMAKRDNKEIRNFSYNVAVKSATEAIKRIYEKAKLGLFTERDIENLAAIVEKSYNAAKAGKKARGFVSELKDYNHNAMNSHIKGILYDFASAKTREHKETIINDFYTLIGKIKKRLGKQASNILPGKQLLKRCIEAEIKKQYEAANEFLDAVLNEGDSYNVGTHLKRIKKKEREVLKGYASWLIRVLPEAYGIGRRKTTGDAFRQEYKKGHVLKALGKFIAHFKEERKEELSLLSRIANDYLQMFIDEQNSYFAKRA